MALPKPLYQKEYAIFVPDTSIWAEKTHLDKKTYPADIMLFFNPWKRQRTAFTNKRQAAKLPQYDIIQK